MNFGLEKQKKRTAKQLAKDLIKKYGDCVIGNSNWSSLIWQ